MELIGKSYIGNKRSADSSVTFNGINPVTSESLSPDYHEASIDDVHNSAELAAIAYQTYGNASDKSKAVFLRKIAENIETLGETLVYKVMAESGLPQERVEGEQGRTCNQLRLFADLIEEGSWVDARIDVGNPDRHPFPKPEIRSMLRSIGPVAVFGSSNFPLAFSVAGGDTASALAAGNPVIVKAHPSHPGTGELVGGAINQAINDCDLPEGVFSLLFDKGIGVGVELVKHPAIKAVGFTGSHAGGKALMDLAASRPEPIPVYAEMSSVNPLIILPEAMRNRGESIADELLGSVNMGVGQFCTSPGLIFYEDQPESKKFINRFKERMSEQAYGTMLNSRIANAYREGVETLRNNEQVKALTSESNTSASKVKAALFQTTIQSFLENSNLSDEVFGPSTLLIAYKSQDELLTALNNLEGQLTATLHGTENDLTEHQNIVDILVNKAGRLIFNGFPTGVEVCEAMVHGGPYPATSDGRSTSVGTQAIFRFCRAVSYQGFPDQSLPEALKKANPLRIWRTVDGNRVKS